jgi:hypothetical protein
MNSETALAIVKATRDLIASEQASREELELHLVTLCTIVEEAVTAITEYQHAFEADGKMLAQDVQIMTAAIGKIRALQTQVESLTNSATIPPAPNPSKDTLPKRDTKGRFIKYGASAPTSHIGESVVNPRHISPGGKCETCSLWGTCTSPTKQYK